MESGFLSDNKILPGQEKRSFALMKERTSLTGMREEKGQGRRCGGGDEEIHSEKLTHSVLMHTHIFKPNTSAQAFTEEPDVRERHQRG